MAQDNQGYGQGYGRRGNRGSYEQDTYGRRDRSRGGQAEQFQDHNEDRYQSGDSYAGGRGQFGDDDYSSQRYSNERFGSGRSYGSRDDDFDRSGRGMSRSRGGYGATGGYDRDYGIGGNSNRSGGGFQDYGQNNDRERYGSRDRDFGNDYDSYESGSRGYGSSRDFGASGYGEAGYSGRSRTTNERGFFEKAGDEVASWFGDEEAERRRRQDHRGRGPSNYQRSNERLLEDACERLTHDHRLDASNINVTAENNEITLDGTVDSRSAKRRAEDCVHDISGVTHVQNNLRVNDDYDRSSYSSYSDTGSDTVSSRTKTETS